MSMHSPLGNHKVESDVAISQTLRRQQGYLEFSYRESSGVWRGDERCSGRQWANFRVEAYSRRFSGVPNLAEGTRPELEFVREHG